MLLVFPGEPQNSGAKSPQPSHTQCGERRPLPSAVALTTSAVKFASARNRKAVVFRFSLGNATTVVLVSILVNYFNIERFLVGIALDLVGDEDIFLRIIVVKLVARIHLH